MKIRTKISLISPLALSLASCAGPVTPLGTVSALTPRQALNPEIEDLVSRRTREPLPKIEIFPEQQVLHGPSPVLLKIKDPWADPSKYRFYVRYNGVDVSRSFSKRSRVAWNVKDRVLEISNPGVKLSAMDEHVIEFVYKNGTGVTAYARYEPPTCNAFRPRAVLSTAGFTPSAEVLGAIERVSKKDGISPAFFTALVAQESGFNPNVVSWAKAMGLTQVTSQAEDDIIVEFPKWPRYPGLKAMPAARVRKLIEEGKLRAQNEWRLDAEMSIQGGAAYLRFLNERWSSPANVEKIRALFANPEIAHTELMLASYNSGYSRVLGELDRLGKDWLKSDELNEARKYVKRIFSYCSFFARNGEDNEGKAKGI